MTTEEARAKWVAALRSGDYKQGQGRLRSGDHYCCLGVACDVLAEDESVKGRWVNPDHYPGDFPKFLSGWSFLDSNEPCCEGDVPFSVKSLLGLFDCGGAAKPASGSPSLTQLNDDEGKTFEEIADLLETGEFYEQA